MMTAKELMVPRFEVIEVYPSCEFKKGDILQRIPKATYDIYHNNESSVVGGIHLLDIIKYPHLFRKMNWWEKRTEDQMPKYLTDADGGIYEIKRWDMGTLMGIIDEKEMSCCMLTLFKPEYGYFPYDNPEVKTKFNDMYSNCPICGSSWDAGLITDHFKAIRENGHNRWKDKTDEQIEAYVTDSYSPPYRFSRIIAVEVAGGYDGTSFYRCPDCNSEWDRFTGDEIKNCLSNN